MTGTTSSPASPQAAHPATAPGPDSAPTKPPRALVPASEPRELGRHELVRYLEDRFACAQACDDCVRACARRHGPPGPGDAPRLDTACADVCDATARLLADQVDQDEQDEQRVRVQVEWCRAICLQCAALCDPLPGSAACAEACRRCAKACDAFLTTLG
ncbi:four-helix bundle copper-binding protein [Streptomyces sp. NPDC018059]|uniref:four-helix bundle copper-binding protein n=1 Tax=Streptomyces sp. NPDC018059 TaxID=3365041 RepID=UPI0037AD3F20